MAVKILRRAQGEAYLGATEAPGADTRTLPKMQWARSLELRVLGRGRSFWLGHASDRPCFGAIDRA